MADEQTRESIARIARTGLSYRNAQFVLAEYDALAAALADAERELRELRPLRSLVCALEADERHGNLTGRAEDAWYAYQEARRG